MPTRDPARRPSRPWTNKQRPPPLTDAGPGRGEERNCWRCLGTGQARPDPTSPVGRCYDCDGRGRFWFWERS
jgi:hypothetical protein